MSNREIQMIGNAALLELPGKVAVKMHSGEQGNKNYLRPEFVKDMIAHVNGTVVECNTAYPGARNSTKKHIRLIKEHEWERYFLIKARFSRVRY